MQDGGLYSFGGSAESHLIHMSSIQGGEGSSPLVLLSPDDMVNSELVVGIKPGDCSVVIEYPFDNFTHIW